MEDEGTPCYKIEKSGKITTYLGVLDRKSKKMIVYESNLTLTKERDLTEIEILEERGDTEQKNNFEKINRKIQMEEKEKQELLRRITSLEH